MIKNVDMECSHGLQGMSTREITLKIFDMDMEKWFGLITHITKELGK